MSESKATYRDICRRCGCGEKAWHHNPPIGGSALDHPFTPSRSKMEAILASNGTPFESCTMPGNDWYAMRFWAKKGLQQAALEHDPGTCHREGCDLCVAHEWNAQDDARQYANG